MPSTRKPSRKINESERRKLWVRAGGRCAICNRYLLEDEFTRRPVNLGELAHNVGWKDSPDSPRGQEDLEIALRNEADNLLLLCHDHNKVIDDKVQRGDYTVNDLLEIKRCHEDRIRYLTGLTEDAETVVLRVIGDVRGATVELSDEAVRAAVAGHAARYPRYGLGFRGAGVELDLRGLPDEGATDYWSVAERRIEDVIDHQVRDGVQRGEVRHLSVFAFARIPLLALVGWHLDDKIPTDLYQKQRGAGESWRWDDDTDPVRFEIEKVRDGDDPRRAVLIAAVSGSPVVGDVPAELDGTPVWRLHPRGRLPDRDVLRASSSLESFVSTYHGFLSMLEAVHPAVEALALLPAVPLAAGIVLGRGVMRDTHPRVQVYDRDAENRFRFAVEVNG